MDKKDPNKSKAKGGHARADKMTKQARSESARLAAMTRWNGPLPLATHSGEMMIDGISILCHNLDDGTRLISQSSLLGALGRTGQPKTVHEVNNGGLQLPVVLQAKNLQPFVDESIEGVFKPVYFKPKTGGTFSLGYKAEALAKICNVYLDAREARKLHRTQEAVAERCRILSRGFQEVGLAALVDEATGFQHERAKDALSKILEQYIAKEYQKWTSTFPEMFYKEIFRLRGWAWTEKSISGKRPSVIGKYTDDIVYDRLAPSILEELRKKNPKDGSGRRKQKHFQWLSGEIGHPRLLAHLEGVTLLMRQSESWEQLKSKLDEFYPIHQITELGIETNIRRKKIGGKN